MAHETIIQARQLLGNYFFGLDELKENQQKFPIQDINNWREAPPIPYTVDFLESVCKTHILFLTVPGHMNSEKISLKAFRNFYGVDPVEQPCLYNQDWYLKERFYSEGNLQLEWCLLRRSLIDESRGLTIDQFQNSSTIIYPSALQVTYAFFAFFVIKEICLWEHEFVWCRDRDANGDQVYVGRYIDPLGLSKNGFSIHRHLQLRNNIGSIDLINKI